MEGDVLNPGEPLRDRLHVRRIEAVHVEALTVCDLMERPDEERSTQHRQQSIAVLGLIP